MKNQISIRKCTINTKTRCFKDFFTCRKVNEHEWIQKVICKQGFSLVVQQEKENKNMLNISPFRNWVQLLLLSFQATNWNLM
jgi:hypothetical protein